MVCKIGGQEFEPDKTRSGMITPAAGAPAPSTPWMSQIFTADAAAVRAGGSETPTWQFPAQFESLDEIEGQINIASPSPDANKENTEVTVEPESAASRFLVGHREGLADELSPSSSSDEGSSSSSSDERRIVKTHPIFEGVPIESGQHYVNNKSAVLHCVTGNERFRCGRKITSGYTIVKELNGIRCTRCYDV